VRPRRLAAAAALIAAALCVSACAGARSSNDGAAAKLVSIGAGLKGPAGLRATVYATGLRNASAFAVDPSGRLFVATSAASDHESDGIYLVARPGARPVKLAAVKGPLGLAWHDGTLYVAAIGRVLAFGHLDGTHFASRRTILDGPVSGASTNGIVVTPDGRLLVSVSTTCDHCAPSSPWAATIVSVRPDGSDLRLYADGIRAGYGLAYFPGTSDVFVSMNQRDDLGDRTPGDWLGLVRPGDDWGFPGCYGQPGTACEGVPDPVGVLDEHAAAGGVAIVTGQLGATVGTAAIVAEWQSGKVVRVSLTKSGRTYSGSVEPFLTGIANPLPVIATKDGALLAGDWKTGTIYRIAQR
jgi:glucose/arabinose dehydrogenase